MILECSRGDPMLLYKSNQLHCSLGFSKLIDVLSLLGVEIPVVVRVRLGVNISARHTTSVSLGTGKFSAIQNAQLEYWTLTV